MSDNSKIFEIMKIQSTTHTTSSTFNIEVSAQNYSLTFGSTVAQPSEAKLFISIIDNDVSQAIDLLKNDRIIFPARATLDSVVPLSNILFVNNNHFSEDNLNSIGTGPNIWNNISQQELCTTTQGTGLKNQISHFVQNWDKHNLGIFSGYFNRFGMEDVQFAKNPNCLGNECVDHQLKLKFSKLSKAVFMNITVDKSLIPFKEPAVEFNDLKIIVNTTRKFENFAKIYINITNSGDLKGNFKVSLNCTININSLGSKFEQVSLNANESISIQFSIFSSSKVDSNESCSVIASVEMQKLWSNENKFVNRTLKIQLFDGYLISLPNFCFGKNSTEKTVCSGHGMCIDEDNCTCITGYTGSQCESPICFGINSTSSNVCSNHGVCNEPNNCNCTEGYVGNQCQFATCFGKNSSMNSICSGNGLCVTPNQCECSEGYVGAECEIPECFGKNSSDPFVCSKNGNCLSQNNCSCSAGYTGNNCQLSVCFGINSNEKSVCSGHGDCISPDNCTCAVGYTGNNCQESICFGKNASNSHVCSGNGNCLSPNNCSCDVGYTGINCQESICFGKNSSDANVCSRNGNCLSPNNCSCESGYTGNICDIPICHGIISNISTVCSGNGECTSPNNCTCNAGFTGLNCQFTTCFNKNSSHASVCSGNGNCTEENNCTCNDGYFGDECATTTCGQIASTSPFVCSGNGECQKLNQCACKAGFSGDNCEICNHIQQLSSLLPLTVSLFESLKIKTTNVITQNIDATIKTECSGINLTTSQTICSNLTIGNDCILESKFKLLNQITSSRKLNSICQTTSKFTKKAYDSCIQDGSKIVTTDIQIDLCNLVNVEYLKKFNETRPNETIINQRNSTENLQILSSNSNFVNNTATFKIQLSNHIHVANFHPILNCTRGVQKPNISSFIHGIGNHSIELSIEMLEEIYECTLSFFIEPSVCWDKEDFVITFTVPKVITTAPIPQTDSNWFFLTIPLGLIVILMICFIILGPLLLILLLKMRKNITNFKKISSQNMKPNFSFLNVPCEWCDHFSSRYVIQLKKGNEIKLIKICGNQNCFYKYMKVGVDDIEKIKSLENQKEVSIEEFFIKKMKFHEDVLLLKTKKFEIPKEPVKQQQTPPVDEIKTKTEFCIDPEFSIDAYAV